jgi:hypothetical protein
MHRHAENDQAAARLGFSVACKHILFLQLLPQCRHGIPENIMEAHLKVIALKRQDRRFSLVTHPNIDMY